MAFMTHPAAGVHRIPYTWLDGFAPSGFRLATAREISGWHDERGLVPPPAEGGYCPSCLQRVPPDRAERRLHREPCASGALTVRLYHCPACGTALAAEVLETDADAA